MGINSKLLDVFEILSVDKSLKFYKNGKVNICTKDKKSLLQVDSQKITTPIPDINRFFEYKSPLKDTFIELSLLENLIKKLSTNNLLAGLNHVGFCYKVESKDKEREMLKQEISKTNLHLYEMGSTDESLWLFVGDATHWQDPLIEYLPVEEAVHEWKDYWLPHIHIDIDTKLSTNAIEKMVNEVFQGKIVPFRTVIIDGVTLSVRARLGIVSGVNITIDFGTKERNKRYIRNILKIIV